MSLSEVSNKENAPQDAEKAFTCVFAEIDGLEILDLELSKEMAIAHKKLAENVAKLVQEHKGYKCVVKGDRQQIVFTSASEAIKFAAALQKVSHSTEWESTEMDAYYQEEEEKMEADAYKKIWNGLRLKIGVHYGKANTITQRKDVEVFQYAGDVVNVAQRVQDVACGGQILATAAAIEAAGDALGDVASKDLGLHQIPWIEDKLNLTQVLPKNLEERKFPKSYLKEAPSAPSPGKVEGLRSTVSAAREDGDASSDEPQSIGEYQARYKKDQDEIASLKKKIEELEKQLKPAEEPKKAEAEEKKEDAKKEEEKKADK